MEEEVYRELLISKLLPAIVEKWPRTDRLSRKIWIQQDGAKSHINTDNEEFREAIQDQELNTGLYTQAANSPDVNLLDLGFFRAIQSFKDTKKRRRIDSIGGACIYHLPEEKVESDVVDTAECLQPNYPMQR